MDFPISIVNILMSSKTTSFWQWFLPEPCHPVPVIPPGNHGPVSHQLLPPFGPADLVHLGIEVFFNVIFSFTQPCGHNHWVLSPVLVFCQLVLQSATQHHIGPTQLFLMLLNQHLTCLSRDCESRKVLTIKTCPTWHTTQQYVDAILQVFVRVRIKTATKALLLLHVYFERIVHDINFMQVFGVLLQK